MSGNNSEQEFKKIMQNAGWKVIKIDGRANLNSSSISQEDINFIHAVKIVFGQIGLPDFLVIKNNAVGFVEIKHSSNLTPEQERKLFLLESCLTIWTYIAKKNVSI